MEFLSLSVPKNETNNLCRPLAVWDQLLHPTVSAAASKIKDKKKKPGKLVLLFYREEKKITFAWNQNRTGSPPESSLTPTEGAEGAGSPPPHTHTDTPTHTVLTPPLPLWVSCGASRVEGASADQPSFFLCLLLLGHHTHTHTPLCSPLVSAATREWGNLSPPWCSLFITVPRCAFKIKVWSPTFNWNQIKPGRGHRRRAG